MCIYAYIGSIYITNLVLENVLCYIQAYLYVLP